MTTMQICSLIWTVLLLVWLIAWLRTKRTQERAPFVSRLSYGVPVGLASWLLFSANLPFPWLQSRIIPKNIYIDAAAIALTALGIAFAIWARFYLGQNWSSAVSVKVGHELIRTGPYSSVRHPIYSGMILAIIGTAIARREPVGFFSVDPALAGLLDQKPNGRKIHAQNLRRRIRRLQPLYRRTDPPLAPLIHAAHRLARVGAGALTCPTTDGGVASYQRCAGISPPHALELTLDPEQRNTRAAQTRSGARLQPRA